MADIVAEAISFFNDLSKGNRDLDLASPLNWSYLLLLAPATEEQVYSVAALLRQQGFTEVVPMRDDGRQRSFLIHLSEVKVHTVESYADRVKALHDFAQRNGCQRVPFGGVDNSNSHP
jgi:hypothetical protein